MTVFWVFIVLSVASEPTELAIAPRDHALRREWALKQIYCVNSVAKKARLRCGSAPPMWDDEPPTPDKN